MNRRQFLRDAGRAGAGALTAAALAGCSKDPQARRWRLCARPHPAAGEWLHRVGVATGRGRPERNVRAAVARLCGPDAARTFIRPGDRVAVKPNIGAPAGPETAANTDPQVVAAVVGLCLEAGAASVEVFDHSVAHDAECYRLSGIADAARRAGARVVLCHPDRFRPVEFGEGAGARPERWPLYQAALEADVLVNVAVAKTHALSVVTLCMKNLMGLQGRGRGKMHARIHRNLADLAAAVRPTLNVLDATRVMVRSGPTGGRREDVVSADTIVCGTSAVTVDAWAADPANLPWPTGHHEVADVRHIVLGAAAGLGTADPSEIEVVT